MTPLSNKQKLTSSVLGIIFTAVLLFAYFSFLHIKEIVQQEEDLYIQSIAEKWTHWRQHNFATINALAKTIANSADETADRQKFQFFLDQTAKSGNLLYLGYGLENGYYAVNDWPIPAGYDPRTRPWYQFTKVAMTERISWPYKSPAVDSPLYISLTAPIIKQGRFIGVVTGDVTMAFLEKELLKDLLDRGGDAFLIDSQGKILIHHDKSHIGQHISEYDPAFFKKQAFDLASYARTQSIPSATQDFRITRLAHSDSLFVLVTDHKHMEQQLEQETLRLLLYFPLVILVIVLAMYFYNKRLFFPILNSLEIDANTQLPNKTNIKKRIATRLIQETQKGVLILFSTDNFNQLTAAYATTRVNALQNQVKLRIQEKLHAKSLFGFFSENRFIAYCPLDANHCELDLLQYLQALSDHLAQPYTIDGEELHCTFSIGASCYPTDSKDLERLIDNAFSAIASIREPGMPKYSLFAPEHNQQLGHALIVSNAMKKAIKQNEFQLVFQPQIDAQTGALIGAETLIRWHSSELQRFVSPAEFIPIAEASDLIVEIGDYVINAAIMQFQQWQARGIHIGKISINISPRQLLKSDFVDKLLQTLAANDVSPTQVELEITETTVIRDPQNSIAVLHRLTAHGLQLAMDDFGTGYSSLEYLRMMPLTKLKIDRAFIQDLDTNERDHVIVKMMIAMANALGYQVLAEGVENEQQLDYLLEHGCRLIQGYYFAKPLSAAQFQSFVEARGQQQRQQAAS